MVLAETRERIIRARLFHQPQDGERFFAELKNFPLHHEKIRTDRLVILPAYKKVIHPVLERHIDKKDSSPVIEVGCGTGSFSRDLAPDWLKSRIVSFDLNLPSLRVLVESDNHAQAFAGTWRTSVEGIFKNTQSPSFANTSA